MGRLRVGVRVRVRVMVRRRRLKFGLGFGVWLGVGFRAFYPITLLALLEPYAGHTKFMFPNCILLFCVS